jgi:hypothetical protein
VYPFDSAKCSRSTMCGTAWNTAALTKTPFEPGLKTKLVKMS